MGATDEAEADDAGGLLSEFGAAATGMEVRSPRYMDDALSTPAPAAPASEPVAEAAPTGGAPAEKEITEFGFEPFDTPATVAEAPSTELAADATLATETLEELETGEVSPLEPAPDHPPTSEEWSTTAPLPESVATQTPDSAPLPVRERATEAASEPEPAPEPAKPKSSGSLFGRADQDEAHRAKANAEDDSEEIAALLAKLRSQK